MRLASCQTPVISALHVGLILLAMMEPLTDCDSTKRLLDVASIERLPPLLSVGATSETTCMVGRLLLDPATAREVLDRLLHERAE